MVNRMRWWISAVIAGLMVLSTVAPVATLAQEIPSAADPALQHGTVIVDAALHVDPASESAQLEFLTAGTTVTLLDAPLTSIFDGQLWIRVGTAQSSGYVPVTVISTEPSESQPVPTPLIVAWELVHSEVQCRNAAHDGAEVISTLYQGEDIGLTGEQVDGWQGVVCLAQQGYVPRSALSAPEPVNEPALGDAPVAETPVADDPIGDVPAEESPTPEDSQPSDVAETPTVEASPSVVETPPADATPSTDEIPPAEEAVPATSAAPPVDEEVQAAAVILPTDPIEEGNGIVSAIIGGGTGYVRGTDGDGVRCRAGANLFAATLTVLPEGAAVTSRGAASGSWQPVYCAGQSGFVWAEFVGNTPGGSTSTGSTGTVQGTDGDWLRCRSDASYNAAVVTTLSPGSSATIRGATQNGWVPIFCGGQNGFVHSDYFGVGTAPGGTTSGRFSSGQAIHVANTDGTGVRFRASASYTAAVISVLLEGSGLTVRAGSSGEWVAVSRGGVNGFIHQDYLAAGAGSASDGAGSPGSSALAAGSRARVTESLRLRSGASLTSSTLTVANPGTVVSITGTRSNGFYPVSWDGLLGYMSADYLVWTTAALSPRSSSPPGTTTPVGNASSGASTATGQSIVNYALRYLGYPYVWAGRGPTSFDCAGFVYWVNFNITGINLVGGVINQNTYGRPVQWGQLQPGDIVNFANTYQPGLSHNGIYIGNNQFIHASNPTDGVIISNLTSPYYLARWYGARRII
ncbi:MAG: SH3 domain-containing protein [Thermomicrobiales bacterium]